MTGNDKRKQSLYFPESMLQEIKEEAQKNARELARLQEEEAARALNREQGRPGCGGQSVRAALSTAAERWGAQPAGGDAHHARRL